MIEPLRSCAFAPQFTRGDACAAEEFDDCIEETPRALRFDGDVAVEFAGHIEDIALSLRDEVFEPVPVGRLVGVQHKSGFAVRVVAIPVGVAEGIVDLVSVEGTHEGLHAHSGFGCRLS